jgi:hypothetical protein
VFALFECRQCVAVDAGFVRQIKHGPTPPKPSDPDALTDLP